MIRRDSVEKGASAATIVVFLALAAHTLIYRDTGMLDMLAIYVYGEMRATTVGRGEGGTFEGLRNGLKFKKKSQPQDDEENDRDKPVA